MRADGVIEHVGRDLSDVYDVNAGVEKAASQTRFQSRGREPRIHADDHCLWFEEIHVCFGGTVVILFINLIGVGAANIVCSKNVPVHDSLRKISHAAAREKCQPTRTYSPSAMSYHQAQSRV